MVAEDVLELKKILSRLLIGRMSETTPETRYIGGSRVILVRKYDGKVRKSLNVSPPEKCLLEREITFPCAGSPTVAEPKEIEVKEPAATETTTEPTTESTTEPMTEPMKEPAESPAKVRRTRGNYGIIGGGLAVSALVGFWLYTKTNASST